MEQLKLIYTTDFYSINDIQLSDCCGHMICLEGEGSFVFNEKCFHFCAGDILILTQPHKLKNLAAAKNLSCTERQVDYYAKQLHITPEYLSKTVKRTTGSSVTSFIARHTIPIIKDYLDNDTLSLTQIADLMNFNSLSYFSRYCSKHLGMSPSEYRQSLQPRKS